MKTSKNHNNKEPTCWCLWSNPKTVNTATCPGFWNTVFVLSVTHESVSQSMMSFWEGALVNKVTGTWVQSQAPQSSKLSWQWVSMWFWPVFLNFLCLSSCPWSVLPPEAKLMSGLCCCWKPRGSLWPGLTLAARGRKVSFAVVLVTAGSWLTVRDTEDFCDNPTPKKNNKKGNSLDREATEESP